MLVRFFQLKCCEMFCCVYFKNNFKDYTVLWCGTKTGPCFGHYKSDTALAGNIAKFLEDNSTVKLSSKFALNHVKYISLLLF